ncbi:OB-fold nucleic acid binding domain-containing protein [Haloquadratum walsbyi]|jgi:Archaea-specific RecJ-like exonuclease, contains DnaJ-type Zn finger domain|uniref:Archaea-specific RecJ-like exonuclease, contains DnaJ-type Zn finger domain protein n=1 Tax=Haloquadratum walsbyi J07HQW2 TaxID=1238425 RepID=U1NIX5_9EURY|nr:OB-fold nucleic acid binding domain-containing protein [Haloquadratum walsbyi]ERG96858.1 MAG: archaea-specific RecJ-like exonuclease, contains DnaJ-type Zn finger domain protein [Haloquadratum walsbyi J07HQW2]
MDFITHEEDVWFDFRGDSPQQLTAGRYYRGTVDGFADFGVFVDLASGVTGLLHRSELDRRLETLDWESDDTVFVQVNNVRDNGNIDLGWSIRQSPSEFRGSKIHDPTGSNDGEPVEPDPDDEADAGLATEATATPSVSRGGSDGDAATIKPTPAATDTNDTSKTDADDTVSAGAETDTNTHTEQESSGETVTTDTGIQTETETKSNTQTETVSASTENSSTTTDATSVSSSSSENETDVDVNNNGLANQSQSASGATAESEVESESELSDDIEDQKQRVSIGSLSDRVGSDVQIEAEVVEARQTGGPTVFELRDESGAVECAAFLEAGVRAYPDVGEGDVVRLNGEVERRRGEIQVETNELTALTGAEAEIVEQRLVDALTAEARPDTATVLATDDPLSALSSQFVDAATEIRRAVLESRPIVVRHAATADGYVAGAAIERAVLPLVKREHDRADAQYHFFTRRPLDDPVYGMDTATNDVTQMLQDNERHNEKLPLVVLVGVGGTTDSLDGIELLGVYDAPRIVVDAGDLDEAILTEVDNIVSPLTATDDALGELSISTGAVGSNLAATINSEVASELEHLPAVSYWDQTEAPSAYVDRAAAAGYDSTQTRELREAVALEAYYQSYQDKRELITDLMFEDDGGLAGHVSEQFRLKLDAEVETAEANLDTHRIGNTEIIRLDADAYSHRFDFPPTALLSETLHRQTRSESSVTVVYSTDELFVHATTDLDVRAVASAAADAVPEGGVTAVGVRQNRIEFLAGARESVVDAVVDAAVAQIND